MSFKRLDPEDFLISAEAVAAGAWTGNIPTITTFFTSSTQEAGTSGDYYLDVYQTSSTLDEADVQFSVAYGDTEGSGSLLFDSGIDGKSPTSTIYGQYQNIVLGDENSAFTYGGVTPVVQNFYAIAVDRSKFKNRLFPGSLALTLTNGSDTVTLTDDSQTASTVTFNEAGRVFQLVSGSQGTVSSFVPTGASQAGYNASGSYGLVLPDVGVILLNPSALALADTNGGIGFTTTRSSNTDDNNPSSLYEIITSFTLQSEETVTSDYVFVRARNSEFNYSANPSFSSGSVGEVTHDVMINTPQTFITTIGLYNDQNELLAVAKLSRPLKKDFTKEALVRVKLDF